MFVRISWIFNRPFPSSLVSLFQSESKCKTILMKMTLICMKMKLHVELIFIRKVSHLDSFWNRGTRELRNGLLQGMRDRSMRSGTELVRKIKLTDWSMAGNLSNRSSGVQIPCDICTRLKRYLYSAKCSWIIKHDIPWVTFILLVLYTQAYWQVGNITKEIQVTSGIFRFK